MATKTIVRLADLSAGFITNSTASSTYATKLNPEFSGNAIFASASFVGSVQNALNLNNNNIIGVNNLEFVDPGPNEGISWAGGNLWKIYESPNDLTTNSGGNFQIVQNATRRMTIDTGGRVTMPAQPYFHATSSQATTLGNDIFWNFVQNNVGTPSHYNPANGTFTAPVAGAYYFSAHGLWANGDAGDFRVGLFKNGSSVQGSNFISDKYAGRWLTFHINDIIYLAANDFVTVRYFQGGSALHTDSNYNGFTGWLLG
jgi:hypothetical protein